MPALNTTFTPDVNAAFINKLLSAPTMGAAMHASMKRLLDYAREVTKRDKSPVTDFAGVGARLGATSAVMTNWKARGLSRDGALTAEEVFGCSGVWLLKGGRSPVANMVAGVEERAPTYGVAHSLSQPAAGLFWRSV